MQDWPINKIINSYLLQKHGSTEPSALSPVLRKMALSTVMILFFIYFESAYNLKGEIFGTSSINQKYKFCT